MPRLLPLTLVAAFTAVVATGPASAAGDKPAHHEKASDKTQPMQSTTQGSVNIEGGHVDYKAVAGTLVLTNPEDSSDEPRASIFYVAYFRQGADASKRPVTFLYNGGPGSSSVWLHMGAFGPRRVVTNDDSHTPAAPYRLVNNDYSLLDATDLVFIDAPGTGFSRLIAKAKDDGKRKKLMEKRKKEFYGVDQDANAFAQFITRFLSRYGRWNSPKYLFGESYGTTRSAVLSNILESNKDVDLNGVILLSQILSFDNSIDGPKYNPGMDLPYELALPTFAATAWYHKKLPNRPADLDAFLQQVQQFAMGDYAQALAQGSALSPQRKQAIAQKLHEYTGLPVDYLVKADLRVTGGQFEKNLQADADLTTGRLDSRFSGPTMDPLSEDSAYDPQSAAISSAYVSAFNNYVRKQLKFGEHMQFKPGISVWKSWDFKHKPPGVPFALPQSTNVMLDLATAMKYNPDLKVMLNGGYYDLATPYYAAIYEMHHLPIPDKLQDNIEYAFYPSGHMVYAHQQSLKALHDKVAAFIQRTDNVGGGN